MATGCCGSGVSAAGGIGLVVAMQVLARAEVRPRVPLTRSEEVLLTRGTDEFGLHRFDDVLLYDSDVQSEEFRIRCSMSRGNKFQATT